MLAVVGLLTTPTVVADPVADLTIAIASDDASAVDRVLSADPTVVNADTGQGRTPLIVAAMMGKPNVIGVLLRRGADPALTADDSAIGNAVTAAFFAMNGSQLTGTADEADPRQRAIALEVLRQVVAPGKGLDVAVRRATTSMTPLMIAAQFGKPDVVKILLDAGAKPNATNGGKFTALDYANDPGIGWIRVSKDDRDEVIRLLQKAGGVRKA